MFSKIVMTLGGLLLMFVLALAVGLGVWSYFLHAQLVQARADLQSLKTENASLKSKISAIQGKVSFLYAWEFGSEEAFDEKVNASGDAKLKTLWEKARKTKSDDDYWKLMDYIVQSIADMVGMNVSPNVVVSDG